MEDIIASAGRTYGDSRGIIADPDLPNKISFRREDEIKKCLRCLACFSNLITKGQFHCAINPETAGNSNTGTPCPPPKRKPS
jgi:2,4-dienoyl-CoA reductase-like NADH-dependent reductase (Old Yellow Enzyme family)